MLDILKKKYEEYNVKQFILLVSLQLAIAPILIPCSFANAGIILSSLLIMIIAICSCYSSSFILDATSNLKSIIVQSNQHPESLISSVDSMGVRIIQEEEQMDKDNTKIDKSEISHSDIFKVLFSQKVKYVPIVITTVFLIGVTVCKCILAGLILSIAFEGVPVLQLFQFWLGVFFLNGALFSFKCLAKLMSIFEPIIITVRYLSILCIFGGILFIIFSNYQIQTEIFNKLLLFRFQNFSSIFSNLVLCLAYHYYTEQNLAESEFLTQSKKRKMMSSIISGIVILLIGIGCMMAFPSQDFQSSNTYLPQLLKSKAICLSYILSFFIFQSIDIFSIYIIQIRKNLFEAVNAKIDPRQFTLKTVLPTLTLRGVVFLGSLYLKNNLQLLTNVTGGIFGGIILFIIPSIEYLATRSKFRLRQQPFSKKIAGICIIFTGIALISMNICSIIL